MFKKIVFQICILISLSSAIHSQCNNSLQYPSGVIQAPFYNNEKVISDEQYAGDYALIGGDIIKNFDGKEIGFDLIKNAIAAVKKRKDDKN